MVSQINTWINQYRKSDWGILYLRLFVGAMILLHIIGKLQSYNVIIGSYPALMFDDNITTFVAFTLSETVLSLMIMGGFFVRFAAFIMALGMFLRIFIIFGHMGWFGVELQVLYIGIYAFLVVSGAGRFSFDSLLWCQKSSK